MGLGRDDMETRHKL